MTPTERALLRRLVFEPETLPRNRNFHTFEDPAAARVRRIAAHLRSLRKAATAPGAMIRVRTCPDGRWELSIEDPTSRLKRRAWITEDERDVLREDPVFRPYVDDPVRT
jgi:hypothetical protein